MCLVKSYTHHPHALNEPCIAENNILVYKALCHRDPVYRTPFRGFPITFVNGICNINDFLEKSNSAVVNLGLHSYYREEKCTFFCAYYAYNRIIKHLAIIPKGSEYFIGLDNEIVSNNLIIFETYDDFEKYSKQNTFIELWKIV